MRWLLFAPIYLHPLIDVLGISCGSNMVRMGIQVPWYASNRAHRRYRNGQQIISACALDMETVHGAFYAHDRLAGRIGLGKTRGEVP